MAQCGNWRVRRAAAGRAGRGCAGVQMCRSMTTRGRVPENWRLLWGKGVDICHTSPKHLLFVRGTAPGANATARLNAEFFKIAAADI